MSADVLITGAAGFIGSNLALHLVEKGLKVIGIDNLLHGRLENIGILKSNPLFSFYESDVSVAGALQDFTAPVIIHLASQKIPRYSNSLITLEQNYSMIKNVLEKCRADKSKLIFASTSDVYGKNANVPYHEQSDFVLGHSEIKRWAYAVSKIYAEHLILANSAEYNFQYSIFRLFGCYGPNQNLSWWGGPQAEFISRALKNEPMEIHGNGLQSRSFLYVDDAIVGIYKLMSDKNSVNQVLNLSSDERDEISILDLAKKIWYMIRSDEPKIKFIPYSTFGSYEDVNRRTGNYSKAKQLINFSPVTDLNKGLELTIDWQRKAMGL